MAETTTPAEDGQLAEAVNVIGGIPVDEGGNALVIDESTDDEIIPSTSEPDEAADETDQETSTEPQLVEVTARDADTEDLLAWAKNKGITSDNPTEAEIKAMKLARESERQFHQDRSKTSELERTLKQFQYQSAPAAREVEQQYDEYGNEVPTPQSPPTGIDPRDAKNAMLEFRLDHPDYVKGSDLDVELGKIVGENPLFWMNNLGQAYDIAESRLSKTSFASQLEAAKEEARREERERLTRQSRTTQPKAQSTSGKSNSEVITADNVDEIVGRHMGDTKWYQEHLPEINKAIGSR